MALSPNDHIEDMADREAIARALRLLDDKNLVWSSDFELIRAWLSTYFQLEVMTSHRIPRRVTYLAERIIGIQTHG
jgi:hypothetical protein